MAPMPRSQLNDGGVLANVSRLLAWKSTADSLVPAHRFWQNLYALGEKYDSIVLFGDVHISDLYLNYYLQFINSKCLVVRVGKFRDSEIRDSIVRIDGISDQILSFIAERGDSALLERVESVDSRYGLASRLAAVGSRSLIGCDESPELSSLKKAYRSQFSVDSETRPSKIARMSAPIGPHKTTLRVFISSTFRDMHGERDALTRIVMPELRRQISATRQLALLGFDLQELDLRWGLPDETSMSNQKTLNRCLDLASNSDIFVGIYGSRKGFSPDLSQLRALPEPLFETISHDVSCLSHCQLSITMLEFLAFINSARWRDGRQSTAEANCFLYFRSEDSIKSVPKQYLPEFISDDKLEMQQYHESIQSFLNYIRGKYRVTVYKDYHAVWGGVINNKPSMKEFEAALQHIYNSLMARIEQIGKELAASLPEPLDDEAKEKDGLAKLRIRIKECVNKLADNCFSRFDTISRLDEILVKELPVHLDRLSRNLKNEQLFKEKSSEAKLNLPKKSKTSSGKLSNWLEPQFRSGGVLLIHGPSQSGKSLILAKLYKHVVTCVQLARSAGVLRSGQQQQQQQQQLVLCFLVDANQLPGSEYFSNVLSLLLLELLAVAGPTAAAAGDQENCQFLLDPVYVSRVAASWTKISSQSIVNEAVCVKELSALVWDLAESLVPTGRTFCIFIDNLEQTHPDSNVLSLDWLPGKLPANIKLVFNCHTKSALHKALTASRSDMLQHAIELLKPTERSHMMRELLDQFGKQLTDKGMHNQMRKVICKRFADQPFYLSIVANELRTFGSYDDLDEKIQSLPQSMQGLIVHVLSSARAQCGDDLTMAVLDLLNCSAADELLGLNFQELRALSTLLMEACHGEEQQQHAADWLHLHVDRLLAGEEDGLPGWIKSRHLASGVDLRTLTDTVESLLEPGGLAELTGPVFKLRKSLRQEVAAALAEIRAKSAGLNTYRELTTHRLLAAYWRHRLLDAELLSRAEDRVVLRRALIAVPYHLFCSGQVPEFVDFITEFKNVESAATAGIVPNFLDLFSANFDTKIQTIKEEFKQISATHERFQRCQKFLKYNLSILNKSPWLIRQQALLSGEIDMKIKNQADEFLEEPTSPPANLTIQPQEVTSQAESLIIQRSSPDVHQVSLLKQRPVIEADLRPEKASITSNTTGESVAVTSVLLLPSDVLPRSAGYRSILICGMQTGSIHLYTTHDMKLQQTLLNHTNRVTALCFFVTGGRPSSGGSGGATVNLLLCTGAADCQVLVWDLSSLCEAAVSTGRSTTVAVFRKAALHPHRRAVSGVATDWHSACQYLVSVGLDGLVQIWQTQKLDTVFKSISIDRPVNCVDFHPEGLRFLIGCWDNTIKLYNLPEGRRISVIRGHSTAVQKARFSGPPRGEHIVSSGMLGEVLLHHSATGELLAVLRRAPSGSSSASGVLAIDFSPGQDLLLGDGHGAVDVLSCTLGRLVADVQIGEPSRAAVPDPGPVSVNCLALWSPTSGALVGWRPLLAVGCSNGTVCVQLGEAPWTPLGLQMDSKSSASRPSTTLSLSSSKISQMTWWQPGAETPHILLFLTSRDKLMVFAVLQNPDSGNSGDVTLSFRAVDVNSAYLILPIDPEFGSNTNQASQNDFSDVKSSGFDDTLSLTSLKLDGDTNKLLLVGGSQRSCGVWLQTFGLMNRRSKIQTKSKMPGSHQINELETYQPAELISGFQGPVSGVDLILSNSADHNCRLCACSHDRSFRVFDIAVQASGKFTVRLLLHQVMAHQDWLTCVAFRHRSDILNKESQELVTGSNDHTLALWKISRQSQPTKSVTASAANIEKVAEFRGHMSSIRTVHFELGFIVSSSHDGDIKMWLCSGQLLSTMKPSRLGSDAGKTTSKTTISNTSSAVAKLSRSQPPVVDDVVTCALFLFTRPGGGETSTQRRLDWCTEDDELEEAGEEEEQQQSSSSRVASGQKLRRPTAALLHSIEKLTSSAVLICGSQNCWLRVFAPLQVYSQFRDTVHSGGVTSVSCVAWPAAESADRRQTTAAVRGGDYERLRFATGSLDGTVKLWNWTPAGFGDIQAHQLALSKFEQASLPNYFGKIHALAGPVSLPTGRRVTRFLAVAGSGGSGPSDILICRFLADPSRPAGSLSNQMLAPACWIRLPSTSTTGQQPGEDSVNKPWIVSLRLETLSSTVSLLVLASNALYQVGNLAAHLLDDSSAPDSLRAAPVVTAKCLYELTNQGLAILKCFSRAGSKKPTDFKHHFHIVQDDGGNTVVPESAEITNCVNFESRLINSYLCNICEFLQDGVVGVSVKGELVIGNKTTKNIVIFEDVFMSSQGNSKIYIVAERVAFKVCVSSKCQQFVRKFSRVTMMLVAADNGEGVLQFVGIATSLLENVARQEMANEGTDNVKRFSIHDPVSKQLISQIGLFYLNAPSSCLVGVTPSLSENALVSCVVGDLTGQIHLLDCYNYGAALLT